MQLQVGMPVVDKWGNFIGKVTEIYDHEALVDCMPEQHRHIYIPLDSCQVDNAGQLRLNVAEEEMDGQGWRESQKSG